MQDIARTAQPRLAAWLGYGGLLPFLALAALSCADRERGALWHESLRTYAALILSFVGALHWGFATVLEGLAAPRRNAMMAWSVVPCLLAFAALLIHSVLGDILLAVGYLAHYWRDLRLAAVLALPAWYLPLRLRLSAVALVCIATGAFAAA